MAACHDKIMNDSVYGKRDENYSLRPLRIEDLDTALSIEEQCYTHPWSRRQFVDQMENPLSAIDLVWVGKEIAGYVVSWLIAGELEILNVAVAPAWRRRGIAAWMLTKLLRRASDQGMTKAFLEVRSGNSAAISLYQQFGFRVIGRRRGYYADGEDALLMEYN